jgi:membrane protease subunit (stomatin/prohibitin family)
MGRPGLVGTAARTAVIAGTATAVSGAVSGKQQQKAAAQQQQAAAQQQPAQQAAAPPPAAPGGMDEAKIEKLKQLGELKDAGVLTEEEFAAEKAKILNS